MSQIIGYRCDACGKIVETGIRLRGDRRQRIDGCGTHQSYRIDFCDNCYARMLKFVKGNGRVAAGGKDADTLWEAYMAEATCDWDKHENRDFIKWLLGSPSVGRKGGGKGEGDGNG